MNQPHTTSYVQSPVIVALDFAQQQKAVDFARQLDPQKVRLKVGKELFVTAGPAVVEQLQTLGFEIFLDLKFHDIPNTVAQACLAASTMGVWMTNVHALGGDAMMALVMKELSSQSKRPLITAVTVLTSMSEQELNNVNVSLSVEEQVLSLTQRAQANTLDGVVCSAQEAAMLRKHVGDDFLLVTPGIRLPSDNADDQYRITTPEQALLNGASHLVIGRPITQSSDPLRTVDEILSRIAHINTPHNSRV